MKKILWVSLFFVVIIPFKSILAINDTTSSEEKEKVKIIENFHLEMVCETARYLWRDYNPPTIGKPFVENMCNNKIQIIALIGNNFKDNTGPNLSHEFLRLLINQKPYQSTNGIDKFSFNIDSTSLESLATLHTSIIDALFANDSTRKMTPKYSLLFDNLNDKLEEVCNRAKAEIEELYDKPEQEAEKEETIAPKVQSLPEVVNVKSVKFTNVPAKPLIVGNSYTLIFDIMPLGANNFNDITLVLQNPESPIITKGTINSVDYRNVKITANKSGKIKVALMFEQGKKEIFVSKDILIEVVDKKVEFTGINIKNEKDYYNIEFKVGDTIPKLNIKSNPANATISEFEFRYPKFIDSTSRAINSSGKGFIEVFVKGNETISASVKINVSEELNDSEKRVIDLYKSANNFYDECVDKYDGQLDLEKLSKQLEFQLVKMSDAKKILSDNQINSVKYGNEEVGDIELNKLIHDITDLKQKINPKYNYLFYVYILIGIILFLLSFLFYILWKAKKIDNAQEKKIQGENSNYVKLDKVNNDLKNELAIAKKTNASLDEENRGLRTEIQHLKIPVKVTQPSIQKSEPPPPLPDPIKYALFPDSPEGFSISRLQENEGRATIYRITVKGDNNAVFRISTNPSIQKKALGNTSRLLETACDFSNSPNDGNSIENQEEGNLIKSGSMWKIVKKAKIKFV